MRQMVVYPHSQILAGSSKAIVFSGPHIQVVDSHLGSILWSTANFDSLEKDGVLRSGPIRCAALNSSGEYLATAGDDKILKIWELEGLRLQSHRELPKRPTSIQFTTRDEILVSDKFGDIFRYPLQPQGDTTRAAKDALSSHENPSGGELILGHTSFLTAFTLSDDEKYIITADRDEHIRVSWFPKGFNIEMYCLGHEKFISALHIPKFNPSTLISGGGDPSLRVWDWMTGSLLRDIPVVDAVVPFIKIRPQGKSLDEDIEGRGRKSRKKKGKKQKKDKEEEPEDDSRHAEEATMETSGVAPEEPLTLAIHKIESLDLDGGTYMIFSAVGATALFSTNFSSSEYTIDSFDFEKPILDFTLRDDGICFVCVDGEWGGSGVTTMVRVVRFTSGQFSTVTDDSPLVKALNSTCLIPASMEDLKVLDLYLPLTALPKNPDAEYNAMNRDVTDIVETPDDGGGIVAGKKIGKKQMGRLKNKQKLLEKVREVAASTHSPEQPENNTEEVVEDGDEDVRPGPESKKRRSSIDHAPEDVTMTEA